MLKQLAKIAVHRSGAMRMVQLFHQERVRILMYHRFPEQDRKNFERQCAFLSARYTVVSLAEAARRLQNRDPVPNLAVITVDDGYADMYETAFPILTKHRLPATLFVTTGFVSRTCWMAGDRVRDYFARAPHDQVELTDDRGGVHVFRTKGGGPGADELRALLKRVPNRTRSRLLEEMEGRGVGAETAPIPPAYQPCTWDQLREMADHEVTIGAHTVTHPILSRVETREETEQEILGSKTCLEERLQREVEVFAYPNGTPQDINAESVACVRAHFQSAVTSIYGLNAPGADIHQLLRLPCNPDLPVSELERMMAGPLRPRAATLPHAQGTY